MPPTSRKRRRGPGLPLDHLGEQGQPHRDDLAVLGQPGDRLVEERFLLAGQVRRLLGQDAEGPAERRQDLAGMPQVEQVDGGRVLAFDEVDLQLAHEPAGRHPEIVADQDDRLDVLAVALPQGGDQLRCSPRPAGRSSHCSNWSSTSSTFWPGRSARPRRSAASASTRPRPGGQLGARLAQRP